ncbi:phospholipase A1 member A-like isoform X2 [Bacillus rossius redtenbacheri]|uniref:phospholipase A1 member A-like isoform X2 n=1 Tax=Bacillus rossius redtenbacheri TaxID=93214 RepID=UPI002FDE6BC5
MERKCVTTGTAICGGWCEINFTKTKITYDEGAQTVYKCHYFLHGRNNIDTPLLLNPDDTSTLQAVDVQKETIFLIHGWLCNRTTFMAVKNAYLKSRDANAVIVEWDRLAAGMFTKSRKDVEVVGSHLAQLADALIGAGQDPARLHIVGHSLGGHMAGIAASKVTKGTVGRVTALDAAGPSYTTPGMEDKVDSTDAAFVQLIHTNVGGLGIRKALGHVDFYVNGGKSQPGCSTSDMGICSHMRAVDIYEQSVTDGKSFPARECTTWKTFSSGKCDENPIAYMGESCSNSTRGIYFLKTSSLPPYTA